MPGADFQAAATLWYGRATLVEEFDVGEWHATVFASHPEDTDSDIGRLVCSLRRGKDLGGLIFARQRPPQFRGYVLSANRGPQNVEVEVFTGGPEEFKALIVRELTRISNAV